MAKSLHGEQITQGILTGVTSDVGPIPRRLLFGPGADLKAQVPLGISYTALRVAQRHLVRLIIESYLESYQVGASVALRSRILENEMSDIHFIWIGSLKPGEPHYYRLRGDAFLIEYWNTGDHIHSVLHELKK